tara:strand:+ start:271 stop:1113 length:843 start_codon:yes stop_codon:yes gene_type:complete
MNIQDAIKEASKILKTNNIKSSVLDSEILMSKALGQDRKFIILNSDNNLNKEIKEYFDFLIKERSKGKPVAYLIKKKDFWKYEFQIKDGILIPRPDTELLVEQVLKITKNKSKLNLLDIGTGSGCILLSILKEKKNFYGTGIDISKEAIEVSKINSKRLNLRNRVKFLKSDIDNFARGKYDLIISNPPYIDKLSINCLNNEVIGYEPRSALYGGLDGTSSISKIIEKASKLIKKNGKLILEIAFDQRKSVNKILNSKGFYINKVLKDLAKNDRCIVSTKI